MARSDLYDNIIYNPVFATGQGIKAAQIASTAAIALQEGPGLYCINPSASAVNVTLYTPAQPNTPQFIRIINLSGATGTLVIKNPAAATIATIAVAGYLELYYVGGNWLCFQTAKSA
jgi:hypothetical protein